MTSINPVWFSNAASYAASIVPPKAVQTVADAGSSFVGTVVSLGEEAVDRLKGGLVTPCGHAAAAQFEDRVVASAAPVG